MTGTSNVTASLGFVLNAQNCEFAKLQEVIVTYIAEIFLATEDETERAKFSQTFSDSEYITSCADIDNFLKKTIVAKKDFLFNTSVENIDSLFTLTMTFLSFATLENVPHTPISSLISDILISTSSNTNTEICKICLNLLFQLYNLSNKSENSLGVILLIKIIQYAKDTNQIDVVLPLFDQIETWKSSSPSGTLVNNERYRELYILLIDCYESLKKSTSSDVTSEYTTKIQSLYYSYLLSLEDEPTVSSESKEVLQILKKCAFCYVENPIQALKAGQDYSSRKGMQALKQLNNASPLYTLVQIFSAGTFQELEEFSNAHKDFIEHELGLQKDASGSNHIEMFFDKLFTDIRLLTIASMASTSTDRILTYDEIAKELHISRDEVEQWVVDATAEDLIECKMDQVQEIVEISKSKGRIVNQSTFERLQNTVQGWKSSVDRMKEAVYVGKSN